MSRLAEWQQAINNLPLRPAPQRYVLGLAFTPDDHVALIKKNRPEWQAGLRNGIGGKIEPGEEPENAMEREFFEETGVRIAADRWEYKGLMAGTDFQIFVYTVMSTDVANVRTMEDEEVGLVALGLVRNLQTMHSIPTLISLCMNPHPCTFILYY